MTVERIATLQPGAQRGELRWEWPLPVDSTVAIFDQRATALAAARQAETTAEAVVYLVSSGTSGSLEIRTASQGLLARLGDVLGQDRELRDELAEEAAAGASVVLAAGTAAASAASVRVFQAYGARDIVRTGRWITERVPVTAAAG